MAGGRGSFERFCLTAGVADLAERMERDAVELCGARHGRGGDRRGHRWGRTTGKLGLHGGKVAIGRPLVRARGGAEMALPSWDAAQAEDWLGRWALNLMLLNVSTRRFERAVRLPGGDIPAPPGAGVSKSATSRRFIALSAEQLRAWMAADLSRLDLLAIRIDGMRITQELTLLAAVGIDGEGGKHPPGLLEGATESAAVVQALPDDLIERALDPAIRRLFIIDGAKALAKAIRRTFGKHAPIQRWQIHKACNILDRLPKHLHASVRAALRQAWELDDAEKAERLMRSLARRLEQAAPSVSDSILEGLEEMLTVIRRGLPLPLRRSLACTNIIENMMGTVRRVCRNVERWRDAAMQEAAKGFRRLKACRQLPLLRAALAAHQAQFTEHKLAPGTIAASGRNPVTPASPFSTANGTSPLLPAHGLVGSMGRRGNSYDDAKAESFMKNRKVDAVYPMAFESFADAADHLAHYIEEVYSKRHLDSASGYRSPAQFKQQHARTPVKAAA